jgi:polyisoprenoid-binding protein YceI
MPHDGAIRLTSANTRVSFAVEWLGVLTVRGLFAGVEGMLRIPDGCIEAASVSVDVECASIRTGIALRDRHLRGPRFLDAARYPVISVRSTRIERPDSVLLVSGRLGLRGAERDVSLRCPLEYSNGAGRDNGGLHSLVRIHSEFQIPRVPYGIGAAEGLGRLNPLMRAIGDPVTVRVALTVPATQLLPALLPALGR